MSYILCNQSPMMGSANLINLSSTMIKSFSNKDIWIGNGNSGLIIIVSLVVDFCMLLSFGLLLNLRWTVSKPSRFLPIGLQ